ncbi:MAG: glycosyltransferase family 2 protein [Deltaproteobacteria bacterium]|nr:glycosyltransferase family 2 protein [Deltaproteobacteria bacterium]
MTAVSIIVSTYNRPDYLRRVIEGYRHQTVQPLELVIADDGSSDETKRIVEEVKEQTSLKISHIWQEDCGFRLAQIRNKAIAKSSGDYLIICDDDVIPHPRLVEDHLRYAERGYFIQGHRVLIGEKVSSYFTHRDISPLNIMRLTLTKQAANSIISIFRFPLPLIRISKKIKGLRGCNMSFFRKDLIAVNGFNEDFIGWGKEDTELAIRFYKYGLFRKDVKFRACCFHLHHPPHPRENIERNMKLVEKAIASASYLCANGLDKYFEPPNHEN